MLNQCLPLPVLALGWDVGGWLGRKQAIAALRCDGVERMWVGAPRTFTVARLRDLGSSIRDLIHIAWQDAPADVLQTHRVVIAIDAPLGLPITFQRLLRGADLPDINLEREIDNTLAYRETERWIACKFKKKPLSAPFDKLGNNATVAMSHVNTWRRAEQLLVMPFQLPAEGCPLAIEVYPALVKPLRAFDCYPRFARLLIETVSAPSDEYDAAACAVLAAGYALDGSDPDLPKLIGPPTCIPEDVMSAEGWIYCVEPDWLQSTA